MLFMRNLIQSVTPGQLLMYSLIYLTFKKFKLNSTPFLNNY